MGFDNTAIAPAAMYMTVPVGSGVHYSNVIDLSGYGSFSAQCTTTGTGGTTFQLQVSNDGVTWIPQIIESLFNGTSQGLQASSTYTMGSTTVYTGAVQARYMRIVAGSTTSGTPWVVTVQAMPQQIRFVTPQTVQGAITPGDNQASAVAVPASAMSMMFNGAAATWYKARTPFVFKSVTATTTTATVVWTPATGYRYRLLRYKMSVPGNAAGALGGEVIATLTDGGASIGLTESFYLPNSTPGTTFGGWSSGLVDLGTFGIGSGASDRALTVTLSQAITTASLRIFVCGQEE